MTAQETNAAGKVGELISSDDVERVLPIATSKEKLMRFAWETKPSAKFLMTANQFMEPNSLFIERLDEEGITVTVRWGLMTQTPEKICEMLNRWLAQVKEGKFRRSGGSGRHL